MTNNTEFTSIEDYLEHLDLILGEYAIPADKVRRYFKHHDAVMRADSLRQQQAIAKLETDLTQVRAKAKISGAEAVQLRKLYGDACIEVGQLKAAQDAMRVQFNNAINFALEQDGLTARELLRDWREGEYWPDFIARYPVDS